LLVQRIEEVAAPASETVSAFVDEDGAEQRLLGLCQGAKGASQQHLWWRP
jgi:hypothetical protein